MDSFYVWKESVNLYIQIEANSVAYTLLAYKIEGG